MLGMKPILAIDFEPFIYPGDALEAYRTEAWPLEEKPVEGAFDYLIELGPYFDVHVISWRSSFYSYWRWWKRFHWPCDKDTGAPQFLGLKYRVEPQTFLYLGGRVMRFGETLPSPLELTKFVPYAPEGGAKAGSP